MRRPRFNEPSHLEEYMAGESGPECPKCGVGVEFDPERHDDVPLCAECQEADDENLTNQATD